ncbi:MAG: DUF721 domain-containing protein [Deltaproteobacteria bacterium]|nr:DUF721 domain-containing protein [Deltaproteobacteria bacterium]
MRYSGLQRMDAVLKKHESGLLEGAPLWNHWNDVVGPAVAKKAQPLSFRGGVLWVTVETAAWMQELQYLTETIMDGLNRACGRSLVTEIRFRQGHVVPIRTREKRRSSDLASERPVAPETAGKIRQEVGKVKDAELRGLLERFWMRAASRSAEDGDG